MKLLDILNEKIEIPVEDKINLSILMEYIFKDWQVFNQKLVPSFKTLRSRVIKETYSNSIAKNNLINVVEFAVKKYVAENTDRRYTWNNLFTKNDRINLTKQLVEFFEKHNLNDKFELLTEDNGIQRDAAISFDGVEIEIVNNTPIMTINFKYDDSTTNYVINRLSKNQTLKLSEFDLQTLQGLVTFKLEDASSGQRLSYLKFHASNNNASRTDLKKLISILNRRVSLEVVGSVEPEQPEQPQEPIVEPVKTEPTTEPIGVEPTISDKELKEIVEQSIKEILGEQK